MFTKRFWQHTVERAVKTFAQSLLAVGLAGATGGWQRAVQAAGLAALLSLLTSLASTRVGDSTSPSLITDGRERQ